MKEMGASVQTKQTPQSRLLDPTLSELDSAIGGILPRERSPLRLYEVGKVQAMDSGVAWVSGLNSVQSEELLRFESGQLGMALNLDRDIVGVVLLDDDEGLDAGATVHRTGRVMDAPVGAGLLGRILDAAGRPLDDRGRLRSDTRWPIERPAPAIMDRLPVTVPLETGLKVIDALIPVGRGQRELVIGDRQTGKTAVALDTIINQRDKNVICVYCAIGQRKAAVAKVIATLQQYHALQYTTVVVASGDDPPGHQFIAPYAATTIAEFFMNRGDDVLVIYDDLTHHARAYRELSLLLRRPPGREAYPGDIFYIHSRLLERATHLHTDAGGGSLTALPIVETQAQNISAYIPTNLISITDGQIYLSPDLFQKGILPAVDVGRSVSRVGGKTQLPAYQAVAGDLRLSYTQFTELESFARFGTRLDEETQQILRHGRHIREVFKQDQYRPVSAPEQVAVLLATTEGLFDRLPLARVAALEEAVQRAVVEQAPQTCARIARGDPLSDEDRTRLLQIMRRALKDGNPQYDSTGAQAGQDGDA